MRSRRDEQNPGGSWERTFVDRGGGGRSALTQPSPASFPLSKASRCSPGHLPLSAVASLRFAQPLASGTCCRAFGIVAMCLPLSLLSTLSALFLEDSLFLYSVQDLRFSFFFIYDFLGWCEFSLSLVEDFLVSQPWCLGSV